jgi:hypothetical protein
VTELDLLMARASLTDYASHGGSIGIQLNDRLNQNALVSYPVSQALQLHPDRFGFQWNKDYRIDENYSQGEARGGVPCYPLGCFLRFGLKVSCQFVDGDN